MTSSVKNLTEIPPVYLKAHLSVLLYLGIDIIPIENPIKRILFYFYSVLVIVAMCLFTTAEFLDMVINFEDIYKMTFAGCYLVTHVLGTVKVLLMLNLRKKLWGHFTTLEDGVFKPNPKRGGMKEVHLVQDAINLCNRQGYVFYTFVFFIITARGVYASLGNLAYEKHKYLGVNTTVVDDTKIMPYATWMPFDYNSSPYYELVFAFQIYSTFVYGFWIGAADAVICGFMMLIKAQFLIVKRELETLIQRAKDFSPEDEKVVEGMERVEMLSDTTQQSAQKLTNECVFHHQELIALCDHAEDDFCYLMLLQFVSSLLIICFQLFQVSSLPPNSTEFFSMSMYLTLMVFQILCYCWHGNEVQLVSGEISTYVFNINWLILKEPIKNSLLLIMMRSQRPCYFTAGKFSLLSLQTFMTIVRGAGSYFMFLKQMNA